jgi:hypothetical protein
VIHTHVYVNLDKGYVITIRCLGENLDWDKVLVSIFNKNKGEI